MEASAIYCIICFVIMTLGTARFISFDDNLIEPHPSSGIRIS
ncbi:hypothetical protein J2Z17_005061 [Rhizobium halophytocola]|uniref:Uncharacterized protein n=1 Tax=Rhizobium halophytocola TaxID=735519 RepID=A0ABS4E6P9_9HYPH|nr:hypothetical protein [Rhizobium halophytocola]